MIDKLDFSDTEINYKRELNRIIQFVEGVIIPIDSTFEIPAKMKQEWLQRLIQVENTIDNKYKNNSDSKKLYREELSSEMVKTLNNTYQDLIEYVNLYFNESNNSKINDIFLVQKQLSEQLDNLNGTLKSLSQQKQTVIQQFKQVISMQGKIYDSNTNIEKTQQILNQLQTQIDTLQAEKRHIEKNQQDLVIVISSIGQQQRKLKQEQTLKEQQLVTLKQKNDMNVSTITQNQAILVELSQKLNVTKDELINKQRELQSNQQEQQTLIDQMQQLNVINNKQKDEIQEFEHKMLENSKYIEEIENQIQTINRQLQLNQVKSEEMRAKNLAIIQETEMIKSKQKDLIDVKRQLADQEAEFGKLRDSVIKEKQEETQLELVLDELKQQEQELNLKQQELRKIQDDNALLDQTNIQKQQQITDIQSQLQQKEQQLKNNLLQQQELLKKQKTLQDLTNVKEQQIKEKLNELQLQLDKPLESNPRIREDIERLQSGINQLEQQFRELNDQINNASAEYIAKQEKLNIETEEANNEQKMTLQYHEKLLKDIQDLKVQKETTQKRQEEDLKRQKAALDAIKVNISNTKENITKDQDLMKTFGIDDRDKSAMIDILKQSLTEESNILRELQQKHKDYQDILQTVPLQLKQTSETVQIIVDNINNSLSDTNQHQQFRRDLNEIFQQIRSSTDIKNQTKNLQKMSELVQKIADSLVQSFTVIKAIVEGMISTQTNIMNSDRTQIQSIIFDKISTLEALFTGNPGKMIGHADLSTHFEKQKMIVDILDLYKRQVFNIIRQIKEIQDQNQKLSSIILKTDTRLLTKDQVAQVKQLITLFKNELSEEQSKLIIQLFQMFHLFLTPLNIFKASPTDNVEPIKQKFIKYMQLNIEQIKLNIQQMQELRVDTVTLEQQLKYQQDILNNIDSNFQAKFYHIERISKDDKNTINNELQVILSTNLKKAVLIQRMLEQVRIDPMNPIKKTKIQKLINEFKQYTNNGPGSISNILKDKKQLLNAGMNIKDFQQFTDDMIVNSLNQLIDDESKDNWFNIANQTISMVPKLFTYTFFIMSTILDIIVSEESNIIIEPKYLELVKETFKAPIINQYQDKTTFTVDQKVIFDKIDEMISTNQDKSALTRIIDKVTTVTGQNLLKRMNTLVNTLQTTSVLAKQLDKKFTGVVGNGKPEQRQRILSLMIDIASNIY